MVRNIFQDSIFDRNWDIIRATVTSKRLKFSS
jgi:hypothetical protein